MTKTISQLWLGNLCPIESLGQNNADISELISLTDNNYKKVENGLDAEHKDLLQKYKDSVDEYIYLISEQAFCDGFCIATKFTSEALTEKHKRNPPSRADMHPKS